MAQGDKDKYTDKQKRQAEHIAKGYREEGVSKEEAKRRAWATVNKLTGGGKKPGGSGRAKKARKSASKSNKPTAAQRSASAKKAARTRARNWRSGGSHSKKSSR